MSPDDFHKILAPYLYAVGLLVVLLGVVAWMLKRHGERAERRVSEAEVTAVERKMTDEIKPS